MLTITIVKSIEDFQNIATLANIIWREHYIPIIGLPQVNYMLEKFQSVNAIAEQVTNGFEYFVLQYNKVPVGYICIKKEAKALFLSKFYILREYRGKKIGKAALVFIEEKSKVYDLNKIRLTVNINNINSIKAYESLGFKKVRPVVIDIGNGFVMDDFEMEKGL
ncbi:GNAT family N-acetyltransferase [Seonamhaeicola aphaedonensis]|uniref:Acetyltransferase (GNAT) family protein n=1 Tax=Seonamhaeicola aphaedonensis TaxID=1461338 RepID=A0A3D9H8Y8_9FLAO|nr:GNAT family N-acetyltransferase [Seonamhaeicola aphaedonensis]RED45964.1 acetyltransferase (GNAT) family protein [Seonamhaeicola aphaedonensis]